MQCVGVCAATLAGCGWSALRDAVRVCVCVCVCVCGRVCSHSIRPAV